MNEEFTIDGHLQKLAEKADALKRAEHRATCEHGMQHPEVAALAEARWDAEDAYHAEKARLADSAAYLRRLDAERHPEGFADTIDAVLLRRFGISFSKLAKERRNHG